MPGLLRGMARTAVVAGTATAVVGGVNRRQQRRWAAQDAQQQPVDPAPDQVQQDDVYTQLEQLGKLRDQGILTQEEFDAKKRQLLNV